MFKHIWIYLNNFKHIYFFQTRWKQTYQTYRRASQITRRPSLGRWSSKPLENLVARSMRRSRVACGKLSSSKRLLPRPSPVASSICHMQQASGTFRDAVFFIVLWDVNQGKRANRQPVVLEFAEWSTRWFGMVSEDCLIMFHCPNVKSALTVECSHMFQLLHHSHAIVML